MYASTYFNMAEQFKIYLNSLPPEEIDEIENDFRVNGNDLLSVKQKVQPNYLILLHDRLLYTDKHLFVPDGKTSPGIIGEKLSLKEVFAKFFRAGSSGLVSSPFLAALRLFFARTETLEKYFLTELKI